MFITELLYPLENIYQLHKGMNLFYSMVRAKHSEQCLPFGKYLWDEWIKPDFA